MSKLGGRREVERVATQKMRVLVRQTQLQLRDAPFCPLPMKLATPKLFQIRKSGVTLFFIFIVSILST